MIVFTNDVLIQIIVITSQIKLRFSIAFQYLTVRKRLDDDTCNYINYICYI